MRMALVPSSSSSSPEWSYDVFLSFRGEDTREGFTSHLYHALCKAGIYTFMDVRLSRGESISVQLYRKIEQSRFSVVVFSANYASSRWCLDELAKIMECKATRAHQVMPVFYKIEPTEIRHQTGKTGECLSRFSEEFTANLVKLGTWRAAMRDAANQSGWTFEKGIEQHVIQEIVVEVSRRLNRTSLSVAHYPIGLDEHIERIDPLLGFGMVEGVRMIGIYGDEGIGKSTIARAIFNSHAHRFDGSSFLANVKAASRQGGLVKVQETLLFETLGDDSIRLGNSHRGASVIVQRLGFKKVLIVIDDVDDLDQLRQLAGGQEWFGFGSRIIITTQDKDLLQAHQVEHLYEAKRLNDIYSYQLFCWNAFRRLEPPKTFVELSRRVLHFITGIPQALILIGSHLYGRSEAEWEAVIVLLQEMTGGAGWDHILEIAIDGLKQFQRALFLIIACFLNGRSRDVITRICNISESHFDIGMEELAGKSMVTVQQNKVWVSESLRGPGRKVLRARSRLKFLVMRLLNDLEKATDELGDDIESALHYLFNEMFEDSDDDDEDNGIDELANAIESAAQTVLSEGEEAVEEITDVVCTALREGEEAVKEIADGISSMFDELFSW